MTTYTFSEAMHELEKAQKERQVLTKRKDGSVLVIKPVRKSDSPLHVKGVDADLSADEIVEILREVRER